MLQEDRLSAVTAGAVRERPADVAAARQREQQKGVAGGCGDRGSNSGP